MAVPGTPGKWLVIWPASGRVSRMTGTLYCCEAPVIVDDDPKGPAVVLDARCLIVDEVTLKQHWNPRDHLAVIERLSPGLATWLRENPDVFATKP